MPAADPPICDYEGSDYQASFWDQGGRAYEDQAEAVALKRLLPPSGSILLELGAGAGRNTPRYTGFERIVLLDFSRSQLEQAQARLGRAEKYIFVAADVYHLPFIDGLFDAATMIRVLHHMADAPAALAQVWNVLRSDAVFVLEFANKRNVKSILRYALGLQAWNPFAPEAVEFARLNFNFHPRRVQAWLEALGFEVERKLTVSHFRVRSLKRLVPVSVLVFLDSILQPTGGIWQFTPSVFFKSRGGKIVSALQDPGAAPIQMFKCPTCGHTPLSPLPERLACGNCGRQWGVANGIYDFRSPVSGPAADPA